MVSMFMEQELESVRVTSGVIPACLLEVIWVGRKAHSIGHDEAQDPTVFFPTLKIKV